MQENANLQKSNIETETTDGLDFPYELVQEKFEKDKYSHIIRPSLEFELSVLNNLDFLNDLSDQLEKGSTSPENIGREVKETIQRLNNALNNLTKSPRSKTSEIADKFVPPSRENISELWMDQPKSSKETVPEFIARLYKPWLGRGLNRAHLKATDPSLSRALTDWLRSHKELPDYLDLPNAYVKHSADGYSDKEYAAYKKVVAVMNREKYRKRKAKSNQK